MKKIAAIIGAGVIAASFAQPTRAADMDYTAAVQQLVVSGMVESWMGYTFIGSVDSDEDSLDDYFNGGRSGRLSLPLGDNLSIQMDVDNETNSSWAYGDSDKYDDDDFHYSFQGLGHLSWRDPSTGLIGVFGGAGTGRAGDRDPMSLRVIGGEAQFYLSNLTLYGQGGYLDGTGDGDVFNDAVFGRGVLRWFTSENSVLQGEASYASGTVEDEDASIIEWGARYGTVIAGLPIIGDTNVFVGYRGNKFSSDEDDESFVDHTFMVGFRTWFGGNTLQEHDRVGATLDAPNFGRWISAGP